MVNSDPTTCTGAISVPSAESLDKGRNDDVLPFSLKGDRYDQSTYYGRFRKMLDVVDPRTLLTSKQELDDAVNLLKEFEDHQTLMHSGTRNVVVKEFDNEKLWQAKKIKDAIVHPDTNEIIPQPFRMSGYVPYNGPVCVGAIMATSTPAIFFFHWMNQTQNALVNFFNRNATQPLNTSAVLQGYMGAVTGSIGMSMGLKAAIDRSKRLTAVQKVSAQRFVALPAIITAAAINVFLMRRNELTTGIDVYYEPSANTNTSTVTTQEAAAPVVVGSSQLAAKKALSEMIISRMVLPLPTFLIPPLALSLLDPIVRKNRRLFTFPVNVTFVMLGFGFGLPATIALFPQNGIIYAKDLEERFHHLRDEQGNPVTVFRYNKGL
mmetsp:Transcript_22486/g.62628  ORF Transcript_22486/g.62628 Transcript_22486/m.62628 type:complete len:377 (-) Transcript_22486:132-1262(-)